MPKDGFGDWREANPSDDPGAFSLPVSVPAAYRALIDAALGTPAETALRRQVEPSDLEGVVSPNESADPLGEARYLVTPRLVHQYRNRVLLLSSGRCLGYCRYCFRRGYTSRAEGFIGEDELEQVLSYLSAHGEVEEILVSGGDPLSGTEEELRFLLARIRSVRPSLVIRLCTRAPIFAPERLSESLVGFLRGVRPLWLIPHVNHPAELGSAQRAAFTRVLDAGIPIQSQTVLLKGINDEPRVLATLFNQIVALGIKPGYLFQCDLAPGTAHFRVPLSDGLSIWRELRRLCSGLSLPVYAVDLPGGGGKYPLSELALFEDNHMPSPDTLRVTGIDGKVYTYRA